MKTKYLVLGLILAVLLVAPLARAQDTQATIRELLAQIAVLQAKIAELTGNSNQSCYNFTRDLYYGVRGNDVIELHNLLIKEGFGGEVDRQGIATFGFNEDMAAAVVRLQAKYGIRQTGYFGPITRAKINSLYACSPQPIPVSTPVISGVSGPTSLAVNQEGKWQVNASNRAGGTLSYSVIWGDEVQTAAGVSAPSFAPVLQQTATFTHRYLRAGNFTPTFYVTNSANQTARASLTVQVTGTLQPTSLLKLISPARGEAVRAGTDYLIRWEATDDLVAKYPRVNIVLGGRTSNGCGAFGCGLAPSRSRFVRALEPLRLLIVKKALAEIDINAYKMTIAANISLNQGSYLWAIPADIRSRVNSINGNYELAFFDVQTGHQVYPYTDNVFLLNSAGGSVENFRLDPAINNEIVYGGDTDEAIAGLIIKTAASSDLEITMLKLVFAQQSGNWSLGEYTDEVSVWLDGQEVARFNGDELTSDNAWTKNILLDSGAIIRAGGEGKLVVKVGGVASAGASWNIDFRQIRFVDDHDDLITEDPATSPVNFSFLGGMI